MYVFQEPSVRRIGRLYIIFQMHPPRNFFFFFCIIYIYGGVIDLLRMKQFPSLILILHIN